MELDMLKKILPIDRKDIYTGLMGVALYFTCLAADGLDTLIPMNMDMVVTDLVAIPTCFLLGTLFSFCIRGKLDPNYKA